MADAYGHADLVTYLSNYEGFGNAFLEAIYYKRPLVCNRYTIYQTAIDPCGCRIPLIEEFLTDEFINEVRCVLDDDALRRAIVEHNCEVASRLFSFDSVKARAASDFLPSGSFFSHVGLAKAMKRSMLPSRITVRKPPAAQTPPASESGSNLETSR